MYLFVRFGVEVYAGKLPNIRFHVSREIDISIDGVGTPRSVRIDDWKGGGPFRSSLEPNHV